MHALAQQPKKNNFSFLGTIFNGKTDTAEMQAKLDAINKSQGVIEFNMDGTVITANDNFLKVLGYTLEEAVGVHHKNFCEESYARSNEYRQFWEKLNRGEFNEGEYKRIGKGGKEVYIQASYNPIFDPNGRPFKVVKFATDITEKIRKVNTILEVVDAVSQGDLTPEVTVTGSDDLGKIGDGLSKLVTSLHQNISTLSNNTQALSASSEELAANGQQMAGSAEETSAQADTISAASEQVNQNIQTVATGSEEMSASIQEIASNATQATKITSDAVQLAESTNKTVTQLGVSSAEVGQVVKVITSIAEQTNLLALNATIEAARAGEAGKGFAVVANEVKELANQTAKATDEISNKISAIQTDTQSAVTAIGEISTVIGRINDISNTIASAVEEQSATTNEISRNVSEASKGSQEITQNISGVATAAKDTTEGASANQKAAEELAEIATTLQKMVGLFKL